MLTREQYKKLSLICFIIAIVLFVLNYLFFHFVTDEGIVLIKQEEAGKPFVANLIGNFATLFLFTSALSLILFIITKENKE